MDKASAERRQKKPEQTLNRRRATRFSRSSGGVFVAVIALCLAIPLAAFFVERLGRAGTVLPGVWVDTEAAAGLDQKGLAVALRRLEGRLRQRTVRVRIANRLFRVEVARLGLSVDVPGTAARALAAGRGGSIQERFRFYLEGWYRGHRVEPLLSVAPAALEALADEWEQEAISERPELGGIFFEEGRAVLRPPRAGWVIDRASLSPTLLAGVRDARGTLVRARLTKWEPKMDPADLRSALARAQEWLAGGIILSRVDPPMKVELTREQLGRALMTHIDASVEPHRVQLTLDPLNIKQYISGPEFSVEAKDASFHVDSQESVVVVPSRSALSVAPADVVARMVELLNAGKRQGELPVRHGVPPKLTTEIARALGIERHLISFSTAHPCCQPRVKNIHRIADLIDGVVVLPGQTFSVNERVGRRTVEHGFVPAPSIEDGEMVETVGGGISQFATTLFNAVLRAGFDIVTRQPHTYWFPRYPMGFEATLSWPRPDLAFRNDSDAGLLIKTEYSQKHIKVKLYGNTGGRRVETEVSPRQDVVDPPVEFVANDSLDVDEEKVVDAGSVGWTVVTVRRVWLDGQRKEEKRKVIYAPKTRRVEIHSCRVPEGEPGHTGAPCPVPEEEPAAEEMAEQDGDELGTAPESSLVQ